MAKLIAVTKGKYTNKYAVDNTIRYITRTRNEEDRRKELITYGSPNVTIFSDDEFAAIDKAIREFKDIQRYFSDDGIKGRRVYHEILCLTEEEAKNFFHPYQIDCFALECSRIYDMQGHQVVYAAHSSENLGLHIHFVVNTYNYSSGLKLHSYFHQNAQREELFNEILQRHILWNTQSLTEYSFRNWLGYCCLYQCNQFNGNEDINEKYG